MTAGSGAPSLALLAVGDRELGLEAGVLVAQPLILRTQGLKALAQGSLGSALPGGNAVGTSRPPVAKPLDPRSYLASWAEHAPLATIEATAGLIDRLARRIEDAIARDPDAEAGQSGGPLAA